MIDPLTFPEYMLELLEELQDAAVDLGMSMAYDPDSVDPKTVAVEDRYEHASAHLEEAIKQLDKA